MQIIKIADVRRGDTIMINGEKTHVAEIAIGETIVAIRRVPASDPGHTPGQSIRQFELSREVVLINRPAMPVDPPAGRLTYTRV